MKMTPRFLGRMFLIASAFTSYSTHAIPVWINEIHYDNTGGDEGEFIEIAGKSGTDLSNYSLALYNGNNGSTYGTVALSGVIIDEAAGFGALAFSYAGIQNGSPDGLALIQSNHVIQFLSYEGNFIATNGPADGLVSIDIGVSEPISTPINQSLQLTGTGSEFSSFTWAGPFSSSPGKINAEQRFTKESVPDSGSSAILLLLGLSGLTLSRRIQLSCVNPKPLDRHRRFNAFRKS